jgi:hypothetical protein
VSACYTPDVELGRRLRLVVVFVAAALVLCATAAGANLPSTTYFDKPAGFRITIPKTWQLVPRSLAGVKARIKQLDKKKETDLASVYSAIVSTAAGRSELTSFVFQAFLYPPISSIQTDVSLGIVRTTTAYGVKELPSLGDTFAKELATTKGSKIPKPKMVTLPAGPAAYIEGTEPAGGGLSTGFDLYLIPHGKRLYELSFRTDASALSKATIFTAIARLFAFV